MYKTSSTHPLNNKKLILHIQLGKATFASSRRLHSLIATGEIKLAGNKQLKIYGTLKCKAGKRMKMSNRVFFSSTKDALDNGYRPCGNCMNKEYKLWKANQS